MAETSPTPTPTVTHNAARHRFEATVEGQVAVADYELDGRVLRLTHTVVPQALEGRGIAGALARAAMAHARSQQLQVDPQCSYMRAYMERHPDTQDLRA